MILRKKILANTVKPIFLTVFAKILFDFKKKNISLNKGKPSENTFNIAKNQEFELITSRHIKNLISPKTCMEQSVSGV